VTTCETPGTYTFPASTITVTETTSVCGAATTVVPPGEATYGGVTTSVVTATTVTCPYATVKTIGDVTTSVIETTVYVCPSAGEYTFAATTTSCSETETLVYPTVSTFVPGTYSHAETTVTIVKTSEVFVCPYETATSSSKEVYVAPSSAVYTAPAYTAPAYSAPAYSAPVYSAPAHSAPAYSAPAYSKPAYSAPAYSKPAYSAPAYSAPAYSAPVHSVHKPKPSASYGGKALHPINTKTNQWAMTYTPYTEEGDCKPASDVMSDIANIKELGFTTIRTYSTDCSGLENIGAACEAHGLLMIIGVFIKETGISDCYEQVNEIIAWGKWELVAMVVIGNEAIFNKYCTAEELAAFIKACKTKMLAAGCPSHVPFTTTEPVSSIIEVGAALCDVIDVVAANVQPYFTSSVVAKEAGVFVKGQLALIAAVCPEAAANGCYNLESGWPTGGNDNGLAKPGKTEQHEAIQSILEVCGEQSVVFSYHNDAWKAPGPLGVEQTWGCADNLW